MKILYYSPHPNLHLQLKSGPGVHMREMIRAFEDEGHTVVPLIMGGLEAPENSSDRQAAPPTTLKQRLKNCIPNVIWQTARDAQLIRFDRYAQNTLEEAIDREQPDLIYERGYYMMTSGVRSASKKQIKHITEVNMPYVEERVTMSGHSLICSVAKHRFRQQLQETDRIIAVSSSLKEYLVKNFNADANKTIVLPNAVRPSFAPPSPSSIDRLKSQLNLTNKFVVGFIGSIFPYHGVDQIITAFHQVAPCFEDLTLLIVGDGAILDDLKQQAEALGIQDRVIFTGRVNHQEAFTYIGAMDIAVMPTSNWYGSPVKIFEYGIMRKAIIAPDVGPIHDIMKHRVHGLITTRENLRSALKELLHAPEQGEQMAEAFYQKVRSEHTWTVNARKTLNFENQ